MSSTELAPRELNVLLVEDNIDDAFLLERHLKRHGFAPQVTRVETGPQMLAALEQNTLPDVVLADYNLPNFSGPAALRLLKQSALDVPFIMMSGAVSEETAVESMRAGAHDYVSKQNLTRLVPALERELKEASGRRNKLAAEEALRASEARFHRLVEAMPLGLLISDASGRVIYANQAVERLLGCTDNDIACGTLTLDSLCPSLTAAHSALTHTAPPEPFEAVCTTRKGETITVLVGIALLNPEAKPEDRQIAAFIADLSLQKKSEELLRRTEKLAVAGRLAASIAHEINNPLEAITNCLYLAAGTELSDLSRSYIELAQNELDRVAQITVQTLRFYRGSTRTVETDVHELIETVFALLESRLRGLQIEVVRQFRATSSVMVQAGEIRQVLANLFGNAMDALPSGGRILLRTAATRDWRSGRHGIAITVADNGTGMDSATLNRLFEPFFSTKGITGTGLGLWISHEIVAKHRGTLHVRSRATENGVAGGTVFRLFIPTEDESYSSDTAKTEAKALTRVVATGA
ncbi:ATP-binding protein [Edaphobacter paludis]|uniref:histidine kinase n=1 Tax=Edaphobacter paludis TaxID=3035702 RepID=A0AAU7CVF0_9BACT